MVGALFNQKLDSISKISARDKWGDRTTNILYQSIPCRFTDDISRIREATMEDERIDAVVYIGKKYQVAVDYIVSYENEDYLIFRVSKARDLLGKVHHQKLLLRSR